MSSSTIHPLRASRWATLLCVLSLAACGEEGGGGKAEDTNPIVNDAGAADASGQCQAGQTQRCACPAGGEGTQTCSAGSFGSCQQCSSALDSGVVSGTNKCVAGRYVGRLELTYVPGPAGLCGLTTLFSGSASGDWVFDLKQDGSVEFFTVGNGCIEALMTQGDAGEARDPLLASLTGTVDCATGQLTGEVRGTYAAVSFCDFGLVKNDYFFKGTMSATFDSETSSFVDGKLDVKELPVAVPLGGEPGGHGTWNAKLSNEPFDPSDSQDCLQGRTFPEGAFADAGI